MSVVDADGTRNIVPGDLQVWVGDGQPLARVGLPRAAGVSGSVKIEDSALLPK